MVVKLLGQHKNVLIPDWHSVQFSRSVVSYSPINNSTSLQTGSWSLGVIWYNREEKKEENVLSASWKGGLPMSSTAFDILPFSLTSLLFQRPSSQMSQKCSAFWLSEAYPSGNLSKNCLMLRVLIFTQNPFLLHCRPQPAIREKADRTHSHRVRKIYIIEGIYF